MELHPYATALADRDLTALLALLDDGVIFHSPVIAGEAFRGKAAMGELLRIVFREVEIERFTHGWGDDGSAGFVADARVRGKETKFTTLLEIGPAGKVREVWVMARPLTGVVAIGEGIGDGLARRQRPRMARALVLLMQPVVAMAALVDRIGSALIRSLNRSVPGAPR